MESQTRPHAGGREGATETLIEAWGHRYLSLNRGNLRQKDWKEVAHSVYSRRNGVKPQRTDVQCKLEKINSTPSKWPFYNCLDYLIATNNVSASRSASVTVKSDSNFGSSRLNSSDSSRDDLAFGGRKNRIEYVEETRAYKELARAISRFGEIYERIESSKQQQMMGWRCRGWNSPRTLRSNR